MNDVAQRPAEMIGIAQRDFEQLEARRHGRVDLRLENHESDIEEQNRTGDAERIRYRIADRRIVVAERGDGRLQRRRAGARTREQSEPVAQRQVHPLHEREAHRAGQQDADQGNDVRPAARRARQSEEELLAVLHAHGVEEEREAERADHGCRHRLGGEPAHREGDEQHGAHAERKALDVDLADEIADGDREKQRHQRLLLQQCPDEFHVVYPGCG